MAAGLTEGRVVLVCGEPVDQIAFRDHVLVLQRQGAELAEADPLADRVAVIAGELHDSGHVDHVRVGGELAFIVAPRLLRIVGERRLNANLVGLHFLVSVFVPAGGYDVPAGVDLPVDHKVDDVAFLDGVTAGFLPGADMGDQIELQQIVRRPLADMADLAQLLLVHDFRVLFEFLCIVCHDEAPFRISVRKGALSALLRSLFSCLTSCKRARTEAFYARTRFYLNSGLVQISSGRYGSECPQSLAAPGFSVPHKAAGTDLLRP